MKMPKWISSLKLGMKLALACAAIELLLLLVVIGSLAQMSKNQLERYNLQREAETRHLLSSAFADPLVRKDAAEVIDVANRLIEGGSDLVMLEVVNLSGTTIVKRAKQSEVGDRLVEADIEIGGYAYGRVRYALSNSLMKQERVVLLTWITGIGIFAILFSIVVFILIGHLLTTRLRELAACADRITTGDSFVCLPDASEDEVGRLSEAFATMTRTLKQRFDELTEAKAAAEAASRAKSTFLANMSHEFRTPLNAIIGLSDLATRRSVDEKQKQQLEKVTQAGRHLNAIVTDVLEVSRIEDGTLPVAREEFKLESVVATLHAIFDVDAEKKDLAFSVEIDPQLAQHALIGDAAHISRVLTNLVSNAVKFTSAGTVSVNIFVQDETVGQIHLGFEVRDTGIGISQEHLQRIFDTFEQADGSMTRQYGGAGLGLPISLGLVKLIKGTFDVESQVGEGSVFKFELSLDKVVKTADPVRLNS